MITYSIDVITERSSGVGDRAPFDNRPVSDRERRAPSELEEAEIPSGDGREAAKEKENSRDGIPLGGYSGETANFKLVTDAVRSIWSLADGPS